MPAVIFRLCNGRYLFRFRKWIIALLFLSFLYGMVLGISMITDNDFFDIFHSKAKPKTKQDYVSLGFRHVGKNSTAVTGIHKDHKKEEIARQRLIILEKLRKKEALEEEIESKQLRTKLKLNNGMVHKMGSHNYMEEEYPPPNYDIHVFYYPWYGTPGIDGQYLHWNHRYLQHWDKREASRWPSGRHVPPNDIGSNYYPALGPYSSRDPKVIEDHMKQIRRAGIGTLAVSWYPPGQADDEGLPSDNLIPLLLDHAKKHELKLCLHVEPYKGRNHTSILKHLKYVLDQYGNHPAFYKRVRHGRQLPLYYIYDSYLMPRDEWGAILRPDGHKSVRHAELDAIFIGLVVEERHKVELMSSGFDGYYTYFASDGFTFGSSTRNWNSLASYAAANEALFIPSVGPGYIDTRIRPWNSRNTKLREQGGYYEQSFKAAIAAKPQIITITSFNEWGEGTQIEEAVPKKTGTIEYSDYQPEGQSYYIQLTKKWVLKYALQSNVKPN